MMLKCVDIDTHLCCVDEASLYHPGVGRRECARTRPQVFIGWLDGYVCSFLGETHPMSSEINQLSRWIAMSGATVKRALKSQVISDVENGLCLICKQNRGHAGRRGLCNKHYLKFIRKLESMPKEERLAFEDRQIRNGRILAVGQIREIRDPNPFPDED